ncbi:hypothetical protein SAMN05421820_108146 [Pedobacter steynii]|uniref:Uncharacterized protein n=1 Tax=Pedobacter steynii TaxID=430522 RepID=A0A1H0CKK0_9SPHI|nr:hypothetical protein SAMN05421820_108146 [Pedobacter steynii]
MQSSAITGTAFYFNMSSPSGSHCRQQNAYTNITQTFVYTNVCTYTHNKPLR